MAETEVQGLSLDTPVNMLDTIQKIPSEMALIGNIDPVRVMVNGNPEDVKTAVRDLCVEMDSYPNLSSAQAATCPWRRRWKILRLHGSRT